MAAGLLGLQASIFLGGSGAGLCKRRFFLPLGLAMKNNYCVELLHFPPDYTIEEDQDYLRANTLIRWGECLIANGAAPSEVDRYQTTIDIYPIGADSGEGSDIDAIVLNNDYTPYTNELLLQWTSSDAGVAKPLVAFGGTVRSWFEDQLGLSNLAVGDSGNVTINSVQIPYTIANRPSYFYNAIDDNLTPQENYPTIQPIMQDDLISSLWQVIMKGDPTIDPVVAYDNAAAYYDTDAGQTKICEQVYIQGFDYDAILAQTECLIPVKYTKSERDEQRNATMARLKKLKIPENFETHRLKAFAKYCKKPHFYLNY